MGYAERGNLNSLWNKKKVMNMSSDFASPISNTPNVTKVTTPTKDEPMVIEITLSGVLSRFKDYLCRMIHPRQSISQELTS